MQELSSTQLVRAEFSFQSWRRSEVPGTITLTLSKGEAKSEGKSESGTHCSLEADAEVAGSGSWSLTSSSPQLQHGCG